VTCCCAAHMVNATSISGKGVECAMNMRTDMKSGWLGLVAPDNKVKGMLGLREGLSLLLGEGVCIGDLSCHFRRTSGFVPLRQL